MASRQRPSLNSFIPWTSVLPILGVEVRGSASAGGGHLPIVPASGARSLQGASPHSASGIIVATVRLRRRCRRTDGGRQRDLDRQRHPQAGRARAAYTGRAAEPEAIERYDKKIDRRKRVMAFWDAARASTDDVGNTGPAQRKLGIRSRCHACSRVAAARWSVRGSLPGHRCRGAPAARCRELSAQELVRQVQAIQVGRRCSQVVAGEIFWSSPTTTYLVASRDSCSSVARPTGPRTSSSRPTQPRGRPWTMGVSMLEAALVPAP